MRIAKRATSGQRRNRLVLVGLVLAALMMLAVLAMTQLAQPDVGDVSSPTQLSDQTQPPPAPTSTIGARDEVVERLHQSFGFEIRQFERGMYFSWKIYLHVGLPLSRGG